MQRRTVPPRAVALIFAASLGYLQAQDSIRVRSQNPSPMVEYTRRHARIMPAVYDGVHDTLASILPRTVDIYLPTRHRDREDLLLLLNFHSAAYVTHHAAESSGIALIGVTVNLGGGSSAYDGPFVDSIAFPRLLMAIDSAVRTHRVGARWNKVALAGFSAGYGAVRRILSQEGNRRTVDAALLLDGIHAGYIPERKVLAEGGRVDSTNLLTFLSFARETSLPDAKKRFMITHSEVFPGTFVSTTEATDWLITQLGLKRTPVLQWGPLGMQQLSETRAGNFSILGFAGNSGVDHGDHVHAVAFFLRALMGWKQED